ncbi:protein DBF4 homolog A isoform X1 [Phyllopteryx taeniolatus]|uniref:protein DBF4 homolog A isoform X1 n=1 Tax=Phyllopteryx taeniolatus TaxID=161469 RepID=UPI002AD249DC|nr:protein DBF4 homolog A isoform X1 [Phyllopteryx taeniolatus]
MSTHRGRTFATCSLKENKMKTKGTQRQAGVVWKGKAGKNGEKKSVVKSRQALLKPFAGKVFYLDLPSNRTAESLEKDIIDLGGSVEKFFSKDIKYLVSNKRETKYVQCLRQDSLLTSPQPGQSSPCPRSNTLQKDCGSGNMKRTSQVQPDTCVTSRGKSLVEKAVKKKDILQINKILSKAMEWGVKIFYIDDVLVYIEKKKKTIAGQRPIPTATKTTVKDSSTAKLTCRKAKGGQIRKPFIKIEDSSRHYCPIYLTMTNMPELNLKTLAPHSPFLVDDKYPAGDKQQGKSVKAPACEGQAAGRRKTKDKKRSGYCECCLARYENLMTHLQSERHQAFSKSDAYQVVNQLVSTLHSSFIHFNTFIKRPKCSVSSVQLDIGPFEGSNLRATEIVKKEQHQPADCPTETFSFQVTSGPQSAPLLHSESRTCLTVSHRSKFRPISLKLPSRLNLLTSSPQKAAQDTAPSSGESTAQSHLFIPQVNLDVQVPHTQTHSDQEPRYELYDGSPSVVTNQQETDKNKEPPRKAGGNISEADGECLSSLSCFPSKTVRRKVSAYKRQRWKL